MWAKCIRTCELLALSIILILALNQPILADGFSFVGSYGFQSEVNNVLVDDTLVYVASGYFTVVNIADPANPEIIDSIRVGHEVFDVVVRGNYAYLACGDVEPYSGYLRIVDISDPSNLILIGSLTLPGSWEATSIALYDNYAYLTDGRMQVVDISNPSSPVNITTVGFGFAQDIEIYSNFGLLAGGFGGIAIVDLSDPADPSVAGSYTTPSYAHNGKISSLGSRAYVAEVNGGLQIFDITNHAVPNLLGSFVSTDHIIDVAPGYYTFVATDTAGVAALMAHDPLNIRLIETYNTTRSFALSAVHIAPDTDRVFVCDQNSLLILNFIGNDGDYLPGDFNGNGQVNGLDIISIVNYFKGGATPPEMLYPCPPHEPFFARGDVNGNCLFNGVDIVYFVRVARGQAPGLLSCPDCPSTR